MIREIPPLAVEGIDPWEKVQIDPATRRLAESAAASSGLTVEEWLERAIRRACPSAFRTLSVTIPSSPVLAPSFAADPTASASTAATPPVQPPEIEASLVALLAMAQPQPIHQPAQPPLEPHQAAPTEPPREPVPSPPPVAPIIRQAAAIDPVTMTQPPAAAELPASLRHAPTIAQRLAQHRDKKIEPDTKTFGAAATPPDEGDRLEQAPSAATAIFSADARAARGPKQRFDLWAVRDTDGDPIEPRETQPQARNAAKRLSLIAIGIALAMTAGAVTAQYLIPGRSRVAPPSSSATSSAPTSNALPVSSINSSGSANASLLSIPNPPPSPNVPPPDASSLSYASPSSLPSGVATQPLPLPTPASQNAEPVGSTPAAKLETVKPEPVIKLTKSETATAKPIPLAKGAPAPAQIAAAPLTAPAGAKTVKIEPSDTAPTDPKALASWLEQRAKNGDAIAQYRLGVLYALAQGVQQDYQYAAQLFETSAEAGVAEAQYDIAVMYGEGLGIGRDPVKAVQWYRKAAAQGNANAAFNLGVSYSNGVGVQQSMDQAAQWFRRAASAGIVNAQFNLGLLYERGDGVPVSQVEAYAWYNAAATRGDQGAAQRRDHLASTLAAPTLKEAQARAQQIAQEIERSGGSTTSGSLATDAAFKKP